MSMAEILDQIPKLTPEERNDIRRKLDELDGNQWNDAEDPLTGEEKALLTPALRTWKLTRRHPSRGRKQKRGSRFALASDLPTRNPPESPRPQSSMRNSNLG